MVYGWFVVDIGWVNFSSMWLDVDFGYFGYFNFNDLV